MVPTDGLICLLVGGPDRFIIDRRGKRWRFEDHPQMGPMLLTPKKGLECDKQPPERSPYWEAVQCWYDQGKRIGDDDLCIWEPKKEPKLRHIGGRHYEVLPESA